MKVARLIVLGASAMALSLGTAHAADDKDPGFNVLDKDNDGSVSRAEAAGNPDLAKQFKEADKDNDGKLSRMEYLTVMTKKDINTAREKIGNAIKPGDQSASGSSSKSK